jgi:hypothetical protein
MNVTKTDEVDKEGEYKMFSIDEYKYKCIIA